MKAKLKIFTNDTDWYVARDMKHVKELFKVFVGSTFEELDEVEERWYAIPDDATLSITYDKDDFDEDVEKLPYVCSIESKGGCVKIKATVNEWMKTSSPGFLCSTEW